MNDEPKAEAEPVEGEVQLPTVANTTAVTVRAELDVAVATARAYPRDVAQVKQSIMALAALDPAGMIYALPRAGKPVKGASVRLAEICQQEWGHTAVDARVVGVDMATKEVVAEAIFKDIQRNNSMRIEERRKVTDRHGKLYSRDMINVTGRAAIAVARRNVILAMIPREVWWDAYLRAEALVRGDVKTLAERRAAAVKAFSGYGILPAQVAAAVGVATVEDIGLDELVTLQATYSSIRSGELSVEEAFPKEKPQPADNWKPPEEIEKPEPPLATEPGPSPGDSVAPGSPGRARKLDYIASEGGIETNVQWGQRFIAVIEAAKNAKEIDEWLIANAPILDDIAKDARFKKVDARIKAIVEMRRVAFASKPKEE